MSKAKSWTVKTHIMAALRRRRFQSEKFLLLEPSKGLGVKETMATLMLQALLWTWRVVL